MEPTPTPFLTNPIVQSRAFTLIEMMVVIAIISIISAVAISGQSSFNQTLVLNDTAYTVAYSARQAQSYGISGKGYNSANNVGYGLNFNRDTPNQYTFFVDSASAGNLKSWCTTGTAGQPDFKAGDCLYVNGGGDGTLQTYAFTRGFTIGRLCVISNNTRICSDSSGNPLQTLNIVYLRPNTTTIMSGARSSSGPLNSPVTCAEIRIDAPTGGVSKNIRISAYGEVSIGQVCTP
jgi:prepilin-type N-terminal cleavage/methylation domain-containing protein